MSDKQWYEHPSLILQVASLAKLRDQLREENLFEAEDIRPKTDLGEPSEGNENDPAFNSGTVDPVDETVVDDEPVVDGAETTESGN